MRKKKLERVLEEIAGNHNTTAEDVRKEMIVAMGDAQSSADPIVKARWAMIPKEGEKLTLEEFLEYLVSETRRGSL